MRAQVDLLEGRRLLSTSVEVLADIMPGPYGSVPIDLVEVNGYVVFVADDGVHGRELWRTDGTPEGTELLKEFVPGVVPGHEQVRLFPAARVDASRLLFTANHPDHGTELWTTDGTPEGTTLVRDITPGPDGTTFAQHDRFVAAGGYVYFSAADADAGFELWRSDGTEAGTTRVADVYAGPTSSSPLPLVALGDEVFFHAGHPAYGSELWVTDGTEAGTRIVKDINPGPGLGAGVWASRDVRYRYAGATTDQVFFVAYTNDVPGLWATDGTDAGTYLVRQHVAPLGSGYELLGFWDVAGGNAIVYRVIGGADNGTWRSDGTPGGTYKLTTAGGDPSRAADLGDVVVFAGGADHRELWRTDGTVAGTHRVREFATGADVGAIVDVSAAGGAGYFYAGDARAPGLWRTDGSNAGTVFLTPLYAYYTNYDNAGQVSPAALGDRVLLSGSMHGSAAGPELLRTATGVSLSADAGTDPSVNEGAANAALSAAGSIGAISAYEWDFDYDGQSFDVDATGVTTSVPTAGIDGDAGSWIAVRVTDAAGESHIDTARVNVLDVPTTGTLVNSGPVLAGSTATVSFTDLADPFAQDLTELSFRYDFDNDGTWDGLASASSTATVPAAYLTSAGTRVVRAGIVHDNGISEYTTAITVLPLTEVVVDNPAAALTGTWSTSAAKPGFVGANYLHDANAGKGTKSVAWAAPTGALAGDYVVYARWIGGADRAASVPYDVVHAGGTTTVLRDQRSNGGTWVSLGTFAFDAGAAATVKLRTTGTTGFVIADAVRFVKVAPPTAPSGASAVAQSPTGVRVTWADNSTTETGFKVQRKGPADPDFVTLTTTAAGATSYDDNAAAANTAYQYRVVATNAAGDSVASNVAAVTTPSTPPPGGDEVVVDNAAATLVGTWSTSTTTPGYHGANYLHDGKAGKGTKSVRWTPTLAATGTYAVYARWIGGTDRPTNAPYDVAHAGGTATVLKDQRTNGGSWQLLGQWQFDAGTTGSVLLRTTGTTGYVIADAVRFVKVVVVATEVIVDNTAATASAGWTASTGKAGYYGSNYLHDGNAGKGTKTVTYAAALPAAGAYKVYARWTSGTDRASNARYDVTHAGGTSIAYADQRANGGAWVLLGEWTFTTAGQVVLSNAGTSGFVIADAVRFVKV